MSITDSLKNRKHVVDYSTTEIPTRKDIEEILRTALPLVTSKQKGYPYQVYVLGPNAERSKKLYNLCEGNKIETDEIAGMGDPKKYMANPGLYHMRSAPWTLITTPMTRKANAFHKAKFEESDSLWELDNPSFVNNQNRESCAVEIGMLAKAITGATLDRGWDTSYNICFPHLKHKWRDFPFIRYTPTLMQTIGKSIYYKWQTMKPENSKLDTDVSFEDMFKFIDE
tara:strand:+ start:1972 stop:2649 length:678 start_codon:yes stop_codon:yes gene_type:complete